jgi:(2R)-ethylmalonyl-CoA mutase
MSRGEVGKVGVSISSIADMRELFESIDLSTMNTSMTINATAVWLYALYIAVADEQGVDRASLSGTTQNDIIKEYLSRGTYVFPPGPSLSLATDLVAFSVENTPRWNPINICSYHLQEAGATPIQEVAIALSAAVAVLDSVRDKTTVDFEQVVSRISFFVNSGVRFVEEMCKMKAFARMWDQLLVERYGVTDPKARRFRYGVQVNSLGLTEEQPENNVQRIVLEMLAVTLAKDARARAVQLPAWNEAMGLPRPWDQQWSLRMQQVLALESDLLEYEDIFAGSTVIESKIEHMMRDIQTEFDRINELDGVVSTLESGYLKSSLVASHSVRRAAIESGELPIVGVNIHTSTEDSPLMNSVDSSIYVVDPSVESDRIAEIESWKEQRDPEVVRQSLESLAIAVESGTNIVQASIDAAKAGVTTGEWTATLRAVFGEYRAPTGVVDSIGVDSEGIRSVRSRVQAISKKRGAPLRMLVGKPGLDGHSNGAEQIAVRARDCGFEVIYQGIRLRPEEIVAAAVAEDVDVIGLSILSGSHVILVRQILEGLRSAGVTDVPVVVGGIIPDDDASYLMELGVSAVFTPKDFDTTSIMSEIVKLLET